MRVSMSPDSIHVEHADPGDETWTHTLIAEQEDSQVTLLLSSDVFQQLRAAVEYPETEAEL